MKSSFVSCCLVLTAAAVSPVFAQGSLTPPPGGPAPLMKTLQQIEPRGDVNRLPGDAAATYVISAPGSYFLSGDVLGGEGKDGIRIDSSDVSLDLRGFRVDGQFSGQTGIVLGSTLNTQGPPVKRCILRNGIVTGWKNTGIDGSRASQGIYRDLICSANGGSGMIVNGSSVSGCVAGDNTKNGIAAEGSGLSECVAESPASGPDAAVIAVNSQLSKITIPNPGFGALGLSLENCTASDCTVSRCDTAVDAKKSHVSGFSVSRYGRGILADRSTVSGCVAAQGQGGPGSAFGIVALNDCLITGNQTINNRVGIFVQGTWCRVERNHVSMRDFGAPDGVGIKAAAVNPGKNLVILNNVTGFDAGLHTANLALDGDDYSGGLGAADNNYFQPQ